MTKDNLAASQYSLDRLTDRVRALEDANSILIRFIRDELGYQVEWGEWGPGDNVKAPRLKVIESTRFVKEEKCQTS